MVYSRGVFEAVVPWRTAVARGEAPEGAAEVGAEGNRFAQILVRLPKVVVSTELPEPDDGTVVVRADVMSRIRELVQAAPGDVVLLAGGRLVGELLNAGELKDIVLIVGTVFLGTGRSLLHESARSAKSVLVEVDAHPPDHHLAALPIGLTGPSSSLVVQGTGWRIVRSVPHRLDVGAASSEAPAAELGR